MGEDVSDMATTTSSLQAKLLALTGGQVDIMLDENTFKNSTQILREMAEAWGDMTDIQRAAALELMGGKRQANVLSALIQNFDTVEKAIETSVNSSGSALKENERYLDSIQGKIDQFNNAMQAMWSNALDSDVVKGFVAFGTELVKIIDKIGPLNVALVGLFTFIETKYHLLGHIFEPAGDGVEELKKQLVEAEEKLAKVTQADLLHGNKKTAQERRDAQERVDILRQQIDDTELKPTVDSELEALIGDQDTFTKEVDAIKMRREELVKAIEADSPDDMLKLIEIDTTSIDDEIAEAHQKLMDAKQTLTKAQAEPVTQRVNGGIRANKGRDKHIVDASQEIADLEKSLDSLQKKKVDTIRYAAQFDLVEMDDAITEASTKLDGMTAAINAKTAAQKADNATTVTSTALTWKELAAQIMSGEVTKANIGASIKNILVTKLASTALGEKMAAILGVTTAELINIPVTQLLTAGFTALAGAIWTALAPLLPFIAIAAGAVVAVVALVKVIDSIWVTAGEAKEKLEELNSEINDLESDLDSLNKELETTQERMEELLSKSSLSFIEQEELDNLRLQNEYLEKQIELQKLILENKKEARLSTAKDVVSKTWDSNSFGKEDYQIDWDDGVIKKDNFWSIGLSGKSAINGGIATYKETEEQMNKYYKGYLSHLDNLGSEHWITKNAEENYLEYRDKLTAQAGGINMVLDDMSNIIAENELQYGDDEEVNKFLDEYYAMTLKWREAQGTVGKSDIIKHIFNDSTSDDIQNLKKQLDDLASSDADNATKQTQAQKLIQDALDDTNGDYQRLQTTVETLKMSAEELAKSFVAVSDAPDINTIKGITTVYQDGINILGKYKSARDEVLGQDENGEDITWNNLFTTDKNGKKVADNLKISAILEGADEDMRNEFTQMVEAVENGKMEVDAAFAKWNISGFGKVLDNLNNEFEAVNNEMFANIADDINGLIDTVSELQAALEDVASTIDLLSTAEEQMANSGQISVKTALDLMATTDDYNKVVTVQNGVLKLATGAQEYLTQAKFNSIKTQLEASATLAENTYQTALASQSELDYADNANVVMTAESIKAEAIGRVSAVVVALGAAMDEITKGNWSSAFSAFGSTYTSATATVVAQSNAMKTSIAELQRDAENKRALANVYSFADDYESFKSNYDFNENPGDKYGEDADSKAQEAIDAFQRDMDYWENRIGANQARYEQVQNEIELLEARGKIAGKEYYQEQIRLEEQRLQLLNQQRAEAKAHLKDFAEGSDEWWEVANTLNDLEGEIDGVTLSIEDLSEAMRNVDVQVFEEMVNRFSNLSDELSNIRDILSSEDMFDEEGNWTEAGVAVLGTHIQDIEMYKQGLAETNQELRDLLNGGEDDYSGNEQAYYDRLQELTQEQHNYTKAIHDSEQSVVEMYENQIEAIEEYTQTLVDSYNDYIDSVKEALDAERDLYDFKKNVQKQSKDIAAIERRIASLSGSTNASDVAERRKLEAELYESRESLNDTYYDHAQQSQQEALDAEATAYEETMTRFIEGLRTGLAEALIDMESFLMGVTVAVSMNADTILSKYEDTGLRLSPELTNPWEAAKAAVGKYGQDALALMNEWTQDTFFDTYKDKVGNGLKAPWGTGTTAVNAFKNSVDTAMNDVVKKVADTVASASAQVSNLHRQILDTKEKAQNINGGGDPDPNPDPNPNGYVNPINSGAPKKAVLHDGSIDPTKTMTDAQRIASKIVRFGTARGSGMNAGRKGDNGIIIWDRKEWKVQNSGETHGPGTDLYKAAVGHLKFGDRQIFGYNGKIYGYLDGVIQGIEGRFWSKKDYNSFASQVKGYGYYAKGTTGTTRDEWAITDEPQFGDELVLVPGKDGNLSFMRKGTGVVPADMTQKLFELAQIPTSDLMNKNLTTIVPNITKNDFKNEFNFESLVHVDTVDSDTLPKLEKMVDKKIDDFSRALNYSLKKFTR